MQIVAAVRGFMARRPILGNMVVYGTLYSGAEFMQQTFNNKIMVPEGSSPKPYETDTLARYAFMGTCVFPHVLYHAYKFLDSKFVGKSLSVVLPKLAADALIVTPINLTLFYVGMSALERKEDLLEEWRKKIIPTFVVLPPLKGESNQCPNKHLRNWILPRTRCPPREGSRTSPQQLRITFHRGIGLGGLTSPSTEGLDSAPRDVLPSALYRLPSS
ncbi:uncharacterized protein LOC123505531 isoform X1 [Portunus trituberculatus]|uniref:uncharacterized protein LOC123505531 isoform X1 n=1 Tax=Portunus trituberculatus TaxID=210409 RepID=UPI001E1CD85F|nr:uncharacterized protein LOC123505531 isoform X1 [Portunus trituberculatus]XP_045112872.1 uncharacterized protein LOC123505531 isoform X1 [Portunus trituberculatus]XP_045112873.1 uncharacterized protein LOC123505531 isoform X1 [Portunus trituberculatus]XP_045112874.1 uncharacterized protein LOC123505531 isoform X1 [Portunus trituberculatus]XP_045112876.1 uncharacterized protein LOC123505531 isoform X1 [Portunus trituberculatus]XP_045112877.1 uncharacterized protein LOC123505531 isoform X1 [P